MDDSRGLYGLRSEQKAMVAYVTTIMSNSHESMTYFKRLIERNSTIPTNKSKDFTTAEDYQDRVDVSASLRRGKSYSFQTESL